MGAGAQPEAPTELPERFEFRHNTRWIDDGQRVATAIRMADGKRLEYRESVDCPPYSGA